MHPRFYRALREVEGGGVRKHYSRRLCFVAPLSLYSASHRQQLSFQILRFLSRTTISDYLIQLNDPHLFASGPPHRSSDKNDSISGYGSQES